MTTRPSPLEAYESALRAAERGEAAGWRIRYAGAGTATLPVGAWTSRVHPGDLGLLGRCTGPTLDLGCGPGRLTALLAGRGVPALGVDLAQHAVALCRRRGAAALRRDVFGPLPGEGRWPHLLLADGNVGIGGDPAALLRRCAELLHPAGTLLVETDPRGTGLRRARVRIEPPDGVPSSWFPWAHLDGDALRAVAAGAGLVAKDSWHDRGRWFSVLVPDGRRRRSG